MQIDAPLTALPNAEERKRISDRARKSLADALVLLEQLERFEMQMAASRLGTPEEMFHAAS